MLAVVLTTRFAFISFTIQQYTGTKLSKSAFRSTVWALSHSYCSSLPRSGSQLNHDTVLAEALTLLICGCRHAKGIAK